MSQELHLGDKIWMHYGPNVLIVGHIIDCSPDSRMIGVSQLPFEEYSKMTLIDKATCAISWCETRYCHYLCHVPYEELRKQDEVLSTKPFGFGGVQS